MSLESYARPVSSLRPEQIQDFREAAKELLRELIRKKGEDPNGYVIRDILPKTDLGLANEEWAYTFASAYAEETMVDKLLPDNKFVAIYGYTNTDPDPKTLYFKLKSGVSVKKVIHVQHLYAHEKPEGYFDPVGWSGGEKVGIILYGKSAAEDHPVFLGLVAEPKDETISGGKE